MTIFGYVWIRAQTAQAGRHSIQSVGFPKYFGYAAKAIGKTKKTCFFGYVLIVLILRSKIASFRNINHSQIITTYLLFFYKGNEFSEWKGNAFIGGLKSKALIRIGFKNAEPFEVERFSWSKRVREVEIDDAGAIWVLEDGSNGRLIKFTKPNK